MRPRSSGVWNEGQQAVRPGTTLPGTPGSAVGRRGRGSRRWYRFRHVNRRGARPRTGRRSAVRSLRGRRRLASFDSETASCRSGVPSRSPWTARSGTHRPCGWTAVACIASARFPELVKRRTGVPAVSPPTDGGRVAGASLPPATGTRGTERRFPSGPSINVLLDGYPLALRGRPDGAAGVAHVRATVARQAPHSESQTLHSVFRHLLDRPRPTNMGTRIATTPGGGWAGTRPAAAPRCGA